MNLIRISLIITAFFLTFSASAAELAGWEKKKIAAEFNQYFKSTDAGAMQKLSKNPWAGKRARQNERTQKMLKISATLGSCKSYSLQQRRQCFASGNSASSCELYYKARLDHCSKYF